MEYLFIERQKHHQSKDVLAWRRLSIENTYVSDPQRIKVIPFGTSFTLGNEANPIHVNFHGHQGASGSRGSVATHTIATDRSIVGHSHSPHIKGGHVNVGHSTNGKMGYNEGGYSSWQQGLALVYPNGIPQLILYNPTINSWRQRKEKGLMDPLYFFGPKGIKVHLTDNELVPNGNITDSYSAQRADESQQLPVSDTLLKVLGKNKQKE